MSNLCVGGQGTPDFAEPAAGASLAQPALSWVWLVDLERTAALLVGRCLGGMLQGASTSLEEQDTAYWLKTPLFSNGLEMDIPLLGRRSYSPCWDGSLFKDILNGYLTSCFIFHILIH